MAKFVPCVSHLLEVKDKLIRGVGQVADRWAYTDHTVSIISQQ